MRRVSRHLGLTPTAVVLVVLSFGPADAYRPFDGTDAAVAEPQNLEIELGPTEYVREADVRAHIPESFAIFSDTRCSSEGESIVTINARLP